MHHPKGPGTYILVIRFQQDTHIKVGRAGRALFTAGFYLYVGSALGGLTARLARHARQEKRPHWHIDHVLRMGCLEEIWYRLGDERLECLWAKGIAHSSLASPSAAPLGASDCACHTHLFFSAEHPELGRFRPCLAGGEEIVASPASVYRTPARD